jgi:RNA polymerase sigma-70 factor (ECF subfamily)
MRTPEEDRRWSARLRQGDPDAFADFFREHHPGILNYVHRLSGGNTVLAEDVAQQVFLNFWTHRQSYDLDKPLVPLLLTMARNAWLNAAKRESLRSSTPEEAAAPESVRDRHLEREELQSALDRALQSLDPGVREVFILSRYHELRYGEIAELLGISIKTVEARLSRALKDLQTGLKDFLS